MLHEQRRLLSASFNLYTYGLIERLLWLGYVAADFQGLGNMPLTDFDTDYKTSSGTLGSPRPMYWVIKNGKAKDGPDITNVNVKKVSPCLPSSATNKLPSQKANFTKCIYGASSETFYSGAFIIAKQDRIDANGHDVLEYIDFFNNFNNHYQPTVCYKDAGGLNPSFSPPRGFQLTDFQKIKVYELQGTLSSAAVDVRYVLAQRPLVGVMDSSSNNRYQMGVLNLAMWHPNHRLILSKGQVQASGASSCYTILTEPHFDVINEVTDPTTAFNYTIAIHNFVASGGNFLAQCAGTDSYENYWPADGASAITSSNPAPGRYYQSSR
jgi:hypothetical protein